jgi:glycosyltransferase involved in cell wall biosynthesis
MVDRARVMSEERPSLSIWLPAIRTGSGADVFTLRLAEGLRRHGHRADIRWFPHQWEFASWMLRGAAIPSDIDVIHASTGLAHAFSGRGVPLLATEHQYVRHPAYLPWRSRKQAIYQSLVTGPAAAASLRRADGLTTVSEHAAAAIFAATGRRADVIHNWVDTDTFSPAPVREMRAEDVVRLLFVGNPSRWKGVDIIPELAERLGDGFEIHCMGGLRKAFPPIFSTCRGVTVLESRPVAEMPAVYRQYDIALVPTRYEAFGYVALEAMASGLPVAGFNTTGTAEVCVHGETAMLVPRDDVAALAEAIRALRDPRLRSIMGSAGRARALAVFSEPRSIHAYVEKYRSLIRGGPDART